MDKNERPEIYKSIYCLEENEKYSFNTEHVIHKSFGMFKRALTLNKEVCRNCNQYFGNNIDRILSRDSYEAFLRLKYEIKPSKEYFHIGNERLIMTIPHGQGDWTGVKVGP